MTSCCDWFWPPGIPTARQLHDHHMEWLKVKASLVCINSCKKRNGHHPNPWSPSRSLFSLRFWGFCWWLGVKLLERLLLHGDLRLNGRILGSHNSTTLTGSTFISRIQGLLRYSQTWVHLAHHWQANQDTYLPSKASISSTLKHENNQLAKLCRKSLLPLSIN